MLLESLVKATVELHGFRVVTVTGDAGGLVAKLLRTGVFRPAVASVESRASTGTPARPGTFAMCPSGGSRWRCAMRHRACVSSVRRRACRVDAPGPWETAADPRAAGDP